MGSEPHFVLCKQADLFRLFVYTVMNGTVSLFLILTIKKIITVLFQV